MIKSMNKGLVATIKAVDNEVSLAGCNTGTIAWHELYAAIGKVFRLHHELDVAVKCDSNEEQRINQIATLLVKYKEDLQ